MSRLRLKENLLIFGILLLVVSFLPSEILYDGGDVEEGSYNIYQFQCVTNPVIAMEVRFEKTVSFYIVSLEDSFRFIAGEAMENLTVLLSLENISEYIGVPSLRAPGQYVIFITTSNLDGITSYTLSISRSLPHFWVFLSSICILIIDAVVYLFPQLKTHMSKR